MSFFKAKCRNRKMIASKDVFHGDILNVEFISLLNKRVKLAATENELLR